MTVTGLIAALSHIAAEDPRLAEAEATYGDLERIEGGFIGWKDGRPVINLTPLALDQVGGF